MNSLRARQLVSSFAIIMGSIFILGLLLAQLMNKQELETEQGQLKEIGFDLLGYINFDLGKFSVDQELKEEFNKFLDGNNFNDPNDGTAAYIQDLNTKFIHWHSLDPALGSPTKEGLDPAMASSTLPTYGIEVKPNEDSIDRLLPEKVNSDGELLLDPQEEEARIVYAYGFQHTPYGRYQLVISKSAAKLLSSDQSFKTTLLVLFSSSALLVLLAQLATSFWVIAPIKDFEQEVNRLESGDQESIINDYPDELMPIKSTINAFVQYEVGQKRRYRDALDDLAHSLKTPLAAIQGYIDQSEQSSLDRETSKVVGGIGQQLERMKDIVTYQLKRAVVTNHHAMISRVQLKSIILRLKDSLKKVHHGKNFNIDVKIDNSLKVRMTEGDLLELFGNLLNNACRFCHETVEVSAMSDGNDIIVNIDDDGMGFPDQNPSKLLKRGIRADSHTEGQGIGLAVCTEIVEAAGGSIELLVSPQVGARVRLTLPV